MKTTTRRMQLTVERSETLLLRRTSHVAPCRECGREVKMLAPDAAAAFAGVPVRIIYRMIEAGELHISETNNGRVYVCGESISRTEVRDEKRNY